MNTEMKDRGGFRVLIGFDGSDGARAAAEDLGRAGLPQDVEALVLACADVPVNPPGHPVAVEGGVVITQAAIDAVREAAERELERAGSVAAAGADLLANLFPKWQVRSKAKAGSAYWGVVDTAREWEADLVVVGSHGRSAFGQFFLGSVSQQILSHSGCSVRIGRSPADRARPGRGDGVRLLLAVDGSRDSQTAVDAVAGRQWPPGSEVRVVTVANQRLSMDLTFLLPISPGPALSPVHRLVHSVGDRLRESRLTVTSVLLTGDPKSAIVQEAQQWGADCIFLGAQGHSRLQRILIGSVSASVAARARCSVEVIRRPL